MSFFLLTSCGTVEKLKQIHKPVDLRKEPLDPDEKAKKILLKVEVFL